MKRLGVTEVVVQKFRGIHDERLVLSKQPGFAPIAQGHGNVLLLGGNGTGKSSFVDALEYVLRGKVPRVADRREIDEKSSLCFGECAPDEIRVELHCCVETGEQAVITALGVGEDPVDVPEAAREWYAAVRTYPPILRRADFVRFIESGGADRLREIAGLIGLDAVDEVEGSWKSLVQKLKQQHALTEKQTRRAQEALLTTAAIETEAAVLEETNRQRGVLGQPPVDSLDALARSITIDEDAHDAAPAAAERPSAGAIHAIVTQASPALDDAETQLALVRTAREELSAEISLRSADLVQLLDLGQRLVAQADPQQQDECPLCESTVPELREKLGRRLEALGEAERRIKVLDGAEKELRSKLGGIAAQLSATAEQCRDNHAVPAGLESQLSEVAGSIRAAGNVVADLSAVASAIRTARESLAVILAQLEEAAEAQRDTADEHARAERWLNRVAPAAKGLLDARDAERRAEGDHSRARQLASCLSQARSARLEHLSQALGGTITDYYQRLHPDEGHGELQFEHRHRGLHPRSSFHTKTGHPLGFLSEGHLDSLGIAFFLAFIRHYNSDAKLLVLDDVMTTMDSDHRMRLGRLLGEEFQGFQLIMTTHDRLWAEQLPRMMRAVGSQIRVLRLRPWTPEEGATLVDFDPERWRTLAKDVEADPNSTVARCGVELERFYGAMRTGLALSMRAAPGDQYTLGQLQDAFFAWFGKSEHRISHPEHAKHGDFNGWLKEFKRYFGPMSALRNVAGAHYNEWAQSLSAAEARELVELTVGLIEAFICPICGSPVTANRDLCAIVCPLCSGKTNYPVFWPFGKLPPKDWPRPPVAIGDPSTESPSQEPTP